MKSVRGEGLEILMLTPIGAVILWVVSKLSWTWSNRPEMKFGWVVLLICCALFASAWAARPPHGEGKNMLVVGGAVFGIVVMLVVEGYVAAFGGSPASLVGVGIAYVVVCGSNLQSVYGWSGTKHFLFPLGFLLIAFPLPSIVMNPLMSGLKSMITSGTVAIVRVAGIPAEQAGSLIHLPQGALGVEDACSGVRSLQATLMASIFIGHEVLRWQGTRFALLAWGCGCAVVANLIRSVWLSFVAHWEGITAVNLSHDAAGWTVLLLTLAGVGGGAFVLKRLERSAAAERSKCLPQSAGFSP